MGSIPDYLNWRNYAEIGDFKAPEKQRQIEETLNQMMLTNEGRKLLWDAADLRGGKIRVEPSAPDKSDKTRFDSGTRTLWIHFDQIMNSTYYNADDLNVSERFSLQHAIVHEMNHAADPNLIPGLHDNFPNMVAAYKILEDRGDVKNATYLQTNLKDFLEGKKPLSQETFEKFHEICASEKITPTDMKTWLTQNSKEAQILKDALVSLLEGPAIKKTNDYMKNYYGEEPRIGHGGRAICDAEGKPDDCVPPFNVSDHNKLFYGPEDMDMRKIPGYRGDTQKMGRPQASGDPLLETTIKTTANPSAAFAASASGLIQDVPVPDTVKTNDPVYQKSFPLTA